MNTIKKQRDNDDRAYEVLGKTFYADGKLYWKDNIWRKDLVGKEVGSVSMSDGYRYAKCGKSRSRIGVHRVIFLMHHGYLPFTIDHINRDRDDNRIENLRDALNPSNSSANVSLQVNKSSIYKGVYWHKSRGKWMARVKCEGKYHFLGRFSNEHEAAEKYNQKALELFGEFAHLNNILERTV